MKKERFRYSKEDLDFFREIIQKKLEREVKDWNSCFKSTNPRVIDGATDDDKTRLTNQAKRHESHITDLKNALTRIENGTYGICRRTGELIKKQRLMLVPHATLSVAAKKQRVA